MTFAFDSESNFNASFHRWCHKQTVKEFFLHHMRIKSANNTCRSFLVSLEERTSSTQTFMYVSNIRKAIMEKKNENHGPVEPVSYVKLLKICLSNIPTSNLRLISYTAKEEKKKQPRKWLKWLICLWSYYLVISIMY